MDQNNRLVGIIFGLMFCGFPVFALYLEHLRQSPVSPQYLALLALLFIWGIWILLASLLKPDPDGAFYYFAGSIISAIFAVVLFMFAFLQKTGWSGGIPFVPATWNQSVARLLVGVGGLLLTVVSIAFFRSAMKKRNDG